MLYVKTPPFGNSLWNRLMTLKQVLEIHCLLLKIAVSIFWLVPHWTYSSVSWNHTSMTLLPCNRHNQWLLKPLKMTLIWIWYSYSGNLSSWSCQATSRDSKKPLVLAKTKTVFRTHILSMNATLLLASPGLASFHFRKGEVNNSGTANGKPLLQCNFPFYSQKT